MDDVGPRAQTPGPAAHQLCGAEARASGDEQAVTLRHWAQ